MEKLYTEKKIRKKCISDAMPSGSFVSNSSSEIYTIWKKLDLCIFLLPNPFFEHEIDIHFWGNLYFMYSRFGFLRRNLRKIYMELAFLEKCIFSNELWRAHYMVAILRTLYICPDVRHRMNLQTEHRKRQGNYLNSNITVPHAI